MRWTGQWPHSSTQLTTDLSQEQLIPGSICTTDDDPDNHLHSNIIMGDSNFQHHLQQQIIVDHYQILNQLQVC